MLRSLFSGISGLRQHQTMMDVVGNNIANVNTTGYKASQTVFEDTLSQLLRGAGAPTPQAGGTNPAQVGLGVRLAQITTNFGQGSLQNTGRATDLTIQGDGFFAVRNGGETLYTRSGAFNFDAAGWLVTSSGAYVQGWAAGADGTVDPNGPLTDLRLPVGTLLPPAPTTTASVAGNVPSNLAAGATAPSSAEEMFDNQGVSHKITYRMVKEAGANSWTFEAREGGTLLGSEPVAFDGNGQLTSATTTTFTVPGGRAVTIDLSGLTSFGGDNTFAAQEQNGSSMGTLNSFSLSPDGTLVGAFSNGLKRPLGQIALANFNNPPGLEKIGGSMFRTTVNSGDPQLGAAGTAGRGLLVGNTLEMSNVDLAQEFTNLIVAQRGFQANSRVITSSDEILQDLVNLKR